mgnify:CR=1 FL=1
MIDISLSVSSGLAEALRGLEKKAARKIYRVVARVIIPPLERELDRRLRYTPPKPDYPIRWASERQRRYVMAKLRKENNLPYRRTGALAKGWETSIDLNSGDVTINVENAAPQARYVYGPDQQPFLNKWPVVENIALDIGAELEDNIIEMWPMIVQESLDEN